MAASRTMYPNRKSSLLGHNEEASDRRLLVSHHDEVPTICLPLTLGLGALAFSVRLYIKQLPCEPALPRSGSRQGSDMTKSMAGVVIFGRSQSSKRISTRILISTSSCSSAKNGSIRDSVPCRDAAVTIEDAFLAVNGQCIEPYLF